MYWRSNVDSSKIESLLDKENVTLCEVLSEDAVINEVQVYNERLLNYLLTPTNLTEMLTILISTPEPNEDGVIYFRLPNVICEILSSYVSIIYTTITSSSEYMSLLFKPFIESNRTDGDTTRGPINSVTCSLIFKVAKVLCQQCSGKVLNFLKAVDQILDRFLDNIENNSVADFLVKCIQLFPPGGAQLEFLDWLSKEDVTWNILSRLDVNSNPQVFSKSIQCLVELLLAVRGVKVANSLVSDLESPKVVTHILSVMLGVPMNRSSMISSGLEFIKAIFELPEKQTVSCFSTSFQSSRKTNVKSYDITDSPNVYNPIIDCLVLKLNDFKNILEDSSELKKIRILTAYGGEIVGPLGPHRLALIDLIHHLVLLEQNRIYCEIINTGLISTLLDLFFEFHLNSFLHRFVSEIINKLIVYSCEAKIVNDTRGKNDEICDKILQELFINQKLLLKIISGWENNMTPVPGKNRMIRNTHRPFLRIIANTIEKYCTNFDEIVSSDSLIIWKSFAASRLAEENKRNISKNNDLTGYPDSSSDGEGATESVEDFDYEDALKAYDECIMQEMTKRFPDYQYKPLFLTEKSSVKNELNSNPLTDFFLSTQEDTENAECFETICNVMLTTKLPFEDCIDEIDACNDVELNSTQEEEVIDEIYTDNYGKPSTSPSVIIDSVFREAYKDQNQTTKLHEIKIFDNRLPINQQTNANNSRFYFSTSSGLPSVSKNKRVSETISKDKLSKNVIIDSNIIPRLNFSGLSENNGHRKKEIIPSFGIFKHPRAMSDDKITEHGSPISMDEFDIDEEMPVISTTRYIYEDKISEFSDNSDDDDDIPLSSRLENSRVKSSENLSQLDKILDDKTWTNPAEVSPVEETMLQFDTVQDVTPDLVLTHCNIISPERNDTPDFEPEIDSKEYCNNRSVIEQFSHGDDSSNSTIVKIHLDNPFSPELTRHSSHVNNQNSGVNKNQLFESSKCLTLTKHKLSHSSKHTFSTIYSPLPWTSFQTVNRSTSMPVKISVSSDTSLGGQKSNVIEDPTTLINGSDSTSTCQSRSSN